MIISIAKLADFGGLVFHILLGSRFVCPAGGGGPSGMYELITCWDKARAISLKPCVK